MAVTISYAAPESCGDLPVVGSAAEDAKARGVTPRSAIRRSAHAEDAQLSQTEGLQPGHRHAYGLSGVANGAEAKAAPSRCLEAGCCRALPM